MAFLDIISLVLLIQMAATDIRFLLLAISMPSGLKVGKTRQKKVTVGISCYNEGYNILSLLRSIFKDTKSEDRGNYVTINKTGHNNNNFIISEVIVSDDSSDNTAPVVDEFAKENPSLNIRLMHHQYRRGVPAAWNEIFENATG